MLEEEKLAREAIASRAANEGFSHVWSDALFARERAREADRRCRVAENKGTDSGRAEAEQARWDVGTYVRWCVTAAVTALELLSKGAVRGNGRKPVFELIPELVGVEMTVPARRKFRKEPPWCGFDAIREFRNRCTHAELGSAEKFADIEMANDAIRAVRAVGTELLERLGRSAAHWLQCDLAPGAIGQGNAGHLTVGTGDFEVRYRCAGAEHRHGGRASMPAAWMGVEGLARQFLGILESISIYEGGVEKHKLPVSMRGVR